MRPLYRPLRRIHVRQRRQKAAEVGSCLAHDVLACCPQLCALKVRLGEQALRCPVRNDVIKGLAVANVIPLIARVLLVVVHEATTAPRKRVPMSKRARHDVDQVGAAAFQNRTRSTLSHTLTYPEVTST